MPEINVEQDLNAVNDQIGKLVEELNKVNSARENLIQQVQNLSGVAMYLRGKIDPSSADVQAPNEEKVQQDIEEAFDRSVEYPASKPSAKK